MGALSRETWIGVAGSVLAVGAMAADHLLEDEGRAVAAVALGALVLAVGTAAYAAVAVEELA